MARGETYEQFVEKFKPKKTTDDCMTPPLVYDAVKNWACKKYGIDADTIVRPFWPGADYTVFHYPDGCTVLDNPPFSILSKICEFYLARGIRFFLFAPSLTAFSSRKTVMRMNHIICDADIEYENGAVVRTAFVTSYGDDIVAQTAPDLGAAIADAVRELKADTKKTVPKYEYPGHVVTAAIMQRYSHYGVDFEIRKRDCTYIGELDAQKEKGKGIFGGGLLLSDKAAAERAAAERAAAERAAAVREMEMRAHAITWELSDREKEVIKSLGS